MLPVSPGGDGGDGEEEDEKPGEATGGRDAVASVPPDGPADEEPDEDPDDTSGRLLLHEGRQGKHVRGHNNFSEGRSELTHSDPQSLLDRFAGRGQQVGRVSRGQPDFRERVDFGENIGFWVEQGTNVRVPTTIGNIIYDSRGFAHIVPARPIN